LLFRLLFRSLIDSRHPDTFLRELFNGILVLCSNACFNLTMFSVFSSVYHTLARRPLVSYISRRKNARELGARRRIFSPPLSEQPSFVLRCRRIVFFLFFLSPRPKLTTLLVMFSYPSQSECEWKSRIMDGAGRGGGIRRCDENKTVVEISLYNELSGTISTEIGRLWNLHTL